MRFWSRLEWLKSKSLLSKILTTGLTISHQKGRRTYSPLVSTQTSEDRSSQHKRTLTTTHLLNGSSPIWKLTTRSPTQRGSLSFQNSTNNLALTMIVQKEKEWVPRNTLESRFNLLICRKFSRNGQAKRFSLLRQHSALKLCLVKPIATSCLKVSTVSTKWRTMSFLLSAREQQETWLTKNSPKRIRSTPALRRSLVSN